MVKFTPEEHAAQLRKPSGSGAEVIADYMNRGNVVLYPAALSALNIEPSQQVLELGYGNAPVTADILLSAYGVTYTGIDYSPDSQRMAMGRNMDFIKENRAVFILGEICKMPFANEQFHRVLGINIIYFWENPGVELAEIFRVLKPGGRVVFGYRPRHLLGNMNFTEFGFTLYEPDEFTQLLSDAGFANINTTLHDEKPREIDEKTYPMQCAVTAATKPK